MSLARIYEEQGAHLGTTEVTSGETKGPRARETSIDEPAAPYVCVLAIATKTGACPYGHFRFGGPGRLLT